MIFTKAYDFMTSFNSFLGGFSVFLIGILVVFLALLILILLITLVSKCVTSFNKQAPETTATMPAPMPEIAPAEGQQMDDKELVAVITSAICASMGTTADKLVVRSLRPVNRRTR